MDIVVAKCIELPKILRAMRKAQTGQKCHLLELDKIVQNASRLRNKIRDQEVLFKTNVTDIG